MELVLTTKCELENLIREAVAEAVKNIPDNSKRKESTWLSNREAMEYLSLSRPTLQRYRSSGMLAYSIIGSNVFYKTEDIENLLESGLKK